MKTKDWYLSPLIQALSTLRDESEAIQSEHERLKQQVIWKAAVFKFNLLTQLLKKKELEFTDHKLRMDAEMDDMKIQLLKFESDLNAERDARRVAQNEADAAKSVAQNLLRESQRFITRGNFWETLTICRDPVFCCP